MAEPWCRRTAQGWTIAVHVQPGATRSEVVGRYGERLKVRVAAPARDGRANDAVVEHVAAALGVPRSKVRLVRGERSRDKLLAVRAEGDPARLLA